MNQATKIKQRALNLDPDQALAICIAQGWHQHNAFTMNVIAINPFYKTGNLGISEHWWQISRQHLSSSGKFLWMYPCTAAEAIIQSLE